MECPACHTENPDAYRFCGNCGDALTHRCVVCGFGCAPEARFCGNCGACLTRWKSAQRLERPSFLRAVVASGKPELKQVTVLFADIVGSTELIARLDPEQAMDRLQPAVLLMCDAVEQFGGTIARTLGDGVMALFSAKARDCHAKLACESALYMQAGFARHAHGLRIRVGLHSGQVACDPQAHDVGKGGGVHGLTIHLASRLVGLAMPSGVALSGDCRSLLPGWAHVESLGQQSLKGIPDPVELFRLVGLERGLRPPTSSSNRAVATRCRVQAVSLARPGAAIGAACQL